MHGKYMASPWLLLANELLTIKLAGGRYILILGLTVSSRAFPPELRKHIECINIHQMFNNNATQSRFPSVSNINRVKV